MKLSVVIPCRLTSPHSVEQLASLLASLPDRVDVEVLVVDDGSEMSVPPSPFSRSVFKVLPTTRPTAGGARNTGLASAIGDWVLFADGDDWFGEGDIDRLLTYLGGCKNVDLVCGHVQGYYEPGRVSSRADGYKAILEEARDDWRSLVRFHAPWGKCWRRSFLLDNGAHFDETPVSNDVMFNARMIVAAPKVDLGGPFLYCVRDHEGSLTKRVNAESMRTRIKVLESYNALLRAEGFSPYQVERIKQLRSFVKKAPLFVVRQIWRGWRLGEPVFLTQFSRKMIKMRKVSS